MDELSVESLKVLALSGQEPCKFVRALGAFAKQFTIGIPRDGIPEGESATVKVSLKVADLKDLIAFMAEADKMHDDIGSVSDDDEMNRIVEDAILVKSRTDRARR